MISIIEALRNSLIGLGTLELNVCQSHFLALFPVNWEPKLDCLQQYKKKNDGMVIRALGIPYMQCDFEPPASYSAYKVVMSLQVVANIFMFRSKNTNFFNILIDNG